MGKRRAMSSEKASFVKKQGHERENEFAHLIGLDNEYLNDKQAKKDVIDFNGDGHSVKSGQKKWQIFLYSANRLQNDYGFLSMNGMGQLLVKCLEVFPENRIDYEGNKSLYKEKLKEPMRELCDKLQSKDRLKAFLSKAFFNGGEVQFLTIFSSIDEKIRIFYYKDVVDVLAKKLSIENSKARQKGQFDAQKVIFKTDKTLGEIELRNDSDIHYREIKFWVSAIETLKVLMDNIQDYDMPLKINGIDNTRIAIYGQARKKFKI